MNMAGSVIETALLGTRTQMRYLREFLREKQIHVTQYMHTDLTLYKQHRHAWHRTKRQCSPRKNGGKLATTVHQPTTEPPYSKECEETLDGLSN